jgi:O-antigen/teichoic acid export membrane protein
MILSFTVTSLFAYAYAVVLSWLLPVAAYGLVGVLQAVLLVGSTAVNSGIPWAVAHRISSRPQSGVSRTYLIVAVVSNALFGACLAGLVFLWVRGESAGMEQIGFPVAAIVAATIPIFAVTAVFTSTLQGFLRLGAFGWVRAVETIVRFGAAVLLVELGMGIFGAASGFLIGGIAALVWAVTRMRGLPITDTKVRVTKLMSEYRSVGSFLLVMVSLAGLTYADLIGVKIFSPMSTSAVSTGHYQVAVALSRIPVFLTLAVFTAIYPYAARESSDQTQGVGYARLSLKFYVLLIVPIGLVFTLMPHQVIAFFFPPRYTESSGLLAISGVAVIFLCGVYASSLLLQASGRLWVAATVLPIALAAECITQAFLVPALGPPGAAVGLALTAGVTLTALVMLGQPVLRLPLTIRQAAWYALAISVWALALAVCPSEARLTTVAWLSGATIAYVALLKRTELLTREDATTLLGGIFSATRTRSALPKPGRRSTL